MSAILEARDLTVGYGTLAVARELNLSVEPGRVMLILGPNGAGKTTTLMTLAGALRPVAGEVRLAGDLRDQPATPPRSAGTGVRAAMSEARSPDSPSTRTCGSDRVTPPAPSSCSPSFANTARGEPVCCRAASRRCSRSRSR